LVPRWPRDSGPHQTSPVFRPRVIPVKTMWSTAVCHPIWISGWYRMARSRPGGWPPGRDEPRCGDVCLAVL